MAKSARLKIFIIIVNYNCQQYIFSCLDAISKVKRFKSSKLQVFIVDNNSTDASVQLIKQKFPKTKIIKNKKNLGFSSAANIGIKKALKNKADYIFLLNPDAIINKNSLIHLIELFKEDKSIGIVAPVLKDKYKGKNVYTLGLKFDKILGKTSHRHVSNRPLQPLEEEMVSGCAMLIKNNVFKKIGFFDERFFLYFEDSDFCLRAKKAGFKVFVQPKSVVFHQVSQSIGRFSAQKMLFILKSNLIFILKQVKWYFWPAAFFYLLLLVFKMMINIFKKRKLLKQ